MGADFSRIRSNPLRDHAAVHLQQGRVLLDADFNEAVDIIDRRLRALASDVLGRSTVSQTTPDAFKLSVVAGSLRIGLGRLYVDGLLAENHGAAGTAAADRRFDALMAEPAFTADIAYNNQPYLPQPPALPTAGRHLVYLDVWTREVTALEQPDLVEPALGVDSTVRGQTVWQVRVLGPDAARATCASPDADIDGWAALTAPSSGRLSTGTVDVPPSADPCELPPSGGYRGLENQTYRVEIHDPGQPGAGATFKWSRDNASVASGVASVVSATELELQTLGRDEVLRFNTGDWVEITDDVRELSQAAGELRRITVNEAAQRISFSPALPAGLLPASFPDSTQARARHLRVRRWDQAHTVLRSTGGGGTAVFQDLDAAGSTGAIRVPAAGTTLLLESGISVSFGTVGSAGFKAGDFWVFAARTADASVEILDQAPPRGIHHHYARLGIWEVAAGSVTDCRTPWPPRGEGHDCACTECVTPESHASGRFTIQAAVDRLRDTGGTICLGVGQYALDKPVLVSGARGLRIQGQGAATLLFAPGTAFQVAQGLGIAIEDLAIVSAGQASAIAVRTVIGLGLQRLIIAVVGTGDRLAAGIALSGAVLGATLRDNTVLAPFGIRSGAGAPAPAATLNVPPVQALLTAALRVENNLLWCERSGVALAGPTVHAMATRVSGNELLACRQGGVVMTGATVPGASVHITGNSARLSGPGVVAGVGGLWITDNQLVAAALANGRTLDGAGITLRTGLNPRGGDACQVLANQVSGFEGAGILIAMAVRELIVKLNIVQGCGNGIVSEGDARSDTVAIENNRLADIGLAGNAAAPLTHGIGVHRVGAAAIVGNSVQRIGIALSGAELRAGIVGLGVRRLIASGNQVLDIASPGSADRQAGAGLVLLAPFSHAEVLHNQVDRESLPLFDGGGEWVALLVDGLGDDRRITRVAGYTAVRLDPNSSLVFGLGGTAKDPQRAWVQQDSAAATVGNNAPVTGGISVLGNALGGRGTRALVRLAVASDCLFNDNRCELRGNTGTAGNRPAVDLRAGATIVNANRVRGGLPSIALTGKDKGAPVTVLGNITTGGITGMPSDPWERLNVQG